MKNEDIEWAATTTIFVFFVFFHSKHICICLVAQIDFKVS